MIEPRDLSEQSDLENAVARLVREALRVCGDEKDCDLRMLGETEKPRIVEKVDFEKGVVTLNENVISVRLLELLAGDMVRIEIGCKAVVTPAAIDWLRQKKIAIVRKSAASSDLTLAELNSGVGLISDAEGRGREVALQRQLVGRRIASSCIDFEALVHRCQNQATTSAIVISDLPARDLDLISRVGSLRGAYADSIACVRRLAGKYCPQVWVLDTERLTFSGIVAVADACLRSRETNR